MKKLKIFTMGTALLLASQLTAQQDPELIAGMHFEHWCIQQGIPTQDWTDSDYNRYLDTYCGTDESEELWDSLTNANQITVLTNK